MLTVYTAPFFLGGGGAIPADGLRRPAPILGYKPGLGVWGRPPGLLRGAPFGKKKKPSGTISCRAEDQRWRPSSLCLPSFVASFVASRGSGSSRIAAQLNREGAALGSSDLKNALPRLVKEQLLASHGTKRGAKYEIKEGRELHNEK